VTGVGSPRAREMLARLAREWARSEVPAQEIEELERVATGVMRERSDRFEDEHHPAFLHPLRTVTLLLEVGEASAAAHRTALLLDTESAPDAAVGEELPPEALHLRTRAPDELVELLLLAEPWLRTAWLAERLDQIRHLHLWAGEDRTREALTTAETREVPLAQREGGRLSRAWTDWMGKAARYRIVARAELRPIRRDGHP